VPKRIVRALQRTLAVGLGVAAALAIAEGAAAASRDRAFPHLTCFVADDVYGVRLAPRCEARVRSRRGRVTTVRTDASGRRAATLGAPARPVGAVVLGDSQAMGLHVEWEDTFAARLEQEHAITTLDAAVPTWGPAESIAILDEVAPYARPSHAVLLLHVGNDWHEAEVPNVRRTTACDGWAIRPGSRGISLGPLARSHLVYATRHVLGRVSDVTPLGASPQRLVEDLRWLRRGRDGFRSRLGPHVRSARDACARHRCELLVAVLPVDVQVSGREWVKYRERPIDLRATEILITDVIADARSLGVRAIDLMPALRAASPGAFLSDDPHLSPRGHAAVATAIAGELDAMRMEARR
jgi:hypothetical protein